MYSIYPVISNWVEEGKEFALATVVETWGSSPRTIGAKMAVTKDGEITGSVSGGCVEGAVVSACTETMKTGIPQLLHFDVADETAMNVGLACGGELDVFVSIPTQSFLDAFNHAYSAELTLSHIIMIQGEKLGYEIIKFLDGPVTGSISPSIDQEITTHPLSQTQILKQKTGEILFLDVITPPPKLIIVGGVHIAIALTRIAKTCGYHVIIIDPRRQFGTQSRFPEADQILHLWPDKAFEQISLTSNTALVFLTHDPKIDDPGLISALSSDAFYIGALGSRKTQSSRRQRLLIEGVSDQQLDRIFGPIGLPLSGRSPEEIAVAIMAEIIQTRNKPS